ncbi:MAG TPA: DnaB-like helicase N-terminal domain-containing protein [Candidatus Ozemobacteraceae bacterium]|nr:DnaB-like helicase N-terminal domain-containing protein [Candidatus Ozemobacteraceae bacterium]
MKLYRHDWLHDEKQWDRIEKRLKFLLSLTPMPRLGHFVVYRGNIFIQTVSLDKTEQDHIWLLAMNSLAEHQRRVIQRFPELRRQEGQGMCDGYVTFELVNGAFEIVAPAEILSNRALIAVIRRRFHIPARSVVIPRLRTIETPRLTVKKGRNNGFTMRRASEEIFRFSHERLLKKLESYPAYKVITWTGRYADLHSMKCHCNYRKASSGSVFLHFSERELQPRADEFCKDIVRYLDDDSVELDVGMGVYAGDAADVIECDGIFFFDTACPEEIRTPPREEEALLLGVLLSDGGHLSELKEKVFSKLTPERFMIPEHKTLFGQMVEMHARKEWLLYDKVIDRLRQTGRLKEAGGPAYIEAIMRHAFDDDCAVILDDAIRSIDRPETERLPEGLLNVERSIAEFNERFPGFLDELWESETPGVLREEALKRYQPKIEKWPFDDCAWARIERRLNRLSRRKRSPRLGLFWIHENKVIPFSSSLRRGKTIGKYLTSKLVFSDFWPAMISRFPELETNTALDIPRGVVRYDLEKACFTVDISEDITWNWKMAAEIKKAFGIPSASFVIMRILEGPPRFKTISKTGCETHLCMMPEPAGGRLPGADGLLPGGWGEEIVSTLDPGKLFAALRNYPSFRIFRWSGTRNLLLEKIRSEPILSEAAYAIIWFTCPQPGMSDDLFEIAAAAVELFPRPDAKIDVSEIIEPNIRSDIINMSMIAFLSSPGIRK